mmetsp:Transcript_36410/g.45497  ORF Transcript_36410/g.45497 Transcript_36410/m.45497 type:complete len:415 (+) Transcript_36410:358-1602(+)|eukprot:CAMPEP_0204833898 /NCGR_PEP_ID=MMETSP1346-20131115/18112_1 /ASSEMBLY_ACC=CAM_ASM_000771 /TAXON_ID=215587 /ORGANISM="Aplanochytrium stocchinoi, Strain GSBS06" /LENGTH=414 /DNA_ID=CAMNT_0051966767 /DNA_START=266 /DNA_END=1510 /DNA_ORIENTATION=-
MGSGCSAETEAEKTLFTGNLFHDNFSLIYSRLQTIHEEEEEFSSNSLEGFVEPYLITVAKLFSKEASIVGLSLTFPAKTREESENVLDKLIQPDEAKKQDLLELLLEVAAAFDNLLRSDPFWGNSEDEVWDSIQNEEIDNVLIRSPGDLKQIAEGKNVLQFIDDVGNDFEITKGMETLQSRVVGLDLSNAVFQKDINIALPFLRTLTLCGCLFPLARIDLSGFRFLQSIDVSYVALSEFEISFIAAKQYLRRLIVDGCGITDSSPFLREIEYLTNLQILSLAENSIQSLSLISASLKVLSQLDLRENENFETGKAQHELDNIVRTRFPNIKVFNNRNIVLQPVSVSYGKIDGIKQAMARTDTVADENEDRGSCSCLEGAPCEVEYTCKDWQNRFKIAELREEEGQKSPLRTNAF